MVTLYGSLSGAYVGITGVVVSGGGSVATIYKMNISITILDVYNIRFLNEWNVS